MEVDKQELLSGGQHLDLEVASAGAGMPHPDLAIGVAAGNPAVSALQAHRVHQLPILEHLNVGHTGHGWDAGPRSIGRGAAMQKIEETQGIAKGNQRRQKAGSAIED